MKTFLLIALLALSGCASVKPHVLCDLKGNAQVMQGVSGIGVGQDLNDADPLCAALKASKAK